MTAESAFLMQYRLARHYLNQLRAAAVAVARGQAAASHGLHLFDQEWEQIKHWHTWAVQHSSVHAECARLCRDFPLIGLEVLTVRTSAAFHVTWLEIALEAAQQLGDGTAERAICHELRVTYYRLGALEKLERVARHLLELGEAAGDQVAIGRGYHGLGAYAEERGMYPEAQQHYQRAFEIFTELGMDGETGRALNGLGAVALHIGDYQNAYVYSVRSLELMERGGKKIQVCNALLSIGEVLTRLKDYAGAETYTKRGIEMCRSHGFQRLLGMGLINFGMWAVEQDLLELAIAYFEEGIQAVRAVGTQRQIMQGLSGLGYSQFRLGNYHAALAHLHEGLEMAQLTGMPRYLCSFQRTLADTYLALNHFDAAHHALQEALTMAQNLDAHPPKVRTLASAVDYLRRLGSPEQAAIWAGVIIENPELDEALFKPVCLQLEAALGAKCYRHALEKGKSLTLEDALSQVLQACASLQEVVSLT